MGCAGTSSDVWLRAHLTGWVPSKGEIKFTISDLWRAQLGEEPRRQPGTEMCVYMYVCAWPGMCARTCMYACMQTCACVCAHGEAPAFPARCLVVEAWSEFSLSPHSAVKTEGAQEMHLPLPRPEQVQCATCSAGQRAPPALLLTSLQEESSGALWAIWHFLAARSHPILSLLASCLPGQLGWYKVEGPQLMW